MSSQEVLAFIFSAMGQRTTFNLPQLHELSPTQNRASFQWILQFWHPVFPVNGEVTCVGFCLLLQHSESLSGIEFYMLDAFLIPALGGFLFVCFVSLFVDLFLSEIVKTMQCIFCSCKSRWLHVCLHEFVGTCISTGGIAYLYSYNEVRGWQLKAPLVAF